MNAVPDAFDGLREPPASSEIEQQLLGAILMNGRLLDRVAEFLQPEHFAYPAHVEIYRTCRMMSDRGQQINGPKVWACLEGSQAVAEAGGAKYIAAIAAAAAMPMMVEDHGRMVLDLHQRRELIAIGEDLVNGAFDVRPGVTATEVQEEIEGRLFRLSGEGLSVGGPVAFGQSYRAALAAAEAVYKSDGKLRGLTTGLADLDRKIGGLHETDLIILAGRPSMGKSALALGIAEGAAKALQNGQTAPAGVVAFFSLEMSGDQLAGRSLAGLTGISSHKIRNGPLTTEDMQRLADAAMERDAFPIHVDDTPSLSVAAIRTRSRRLAQKHGLALIVIDYLQLIGQQQERGRRGAENRTQEVSEITRSLKALAKELKVPVIALSQLSRQVEQREDKRPQLSDLRESGSIEQDADAVMFVYREQYYLERAEPGRRPDESDEKFNTRYSQWQTALGNCVNTGEVIIAKQRHGPIGTVRLHFNPDLVTFGNLDSSGGYDG